MKQILSLLLIMLTLGACQIPVKNQASTPPKVVVTCADSRLGTSYRLHDTAKNYLASYYKSRKESELFFAWYATEDSTYMAKTVAYCSDKRNKHYYAVKSLAQKNKTMKKLILQNMRPSEQSQVNELFLDQYRKIFPRDI